MTHGDLLTTDGDRIGVAVVGAGYWGPNLIRNFGASAHFDLRWVCDLDEGRVARVLGRNSTVRATTNIEDVLNDPSVAAVAIATPAATHGVLGVACLETGRHVLIEKPLAASVGEGEKLVTTAEQRDLVLMCDHTYCYTPAVQRIRQYIEEGALGEVQYVDSVRINLGLLQPDIDVLWDLAPHDLSIFDFLLPTTQRPVSVAAHGADPLGQGRASLAYLTLPLAGGAVAHAHVNWLSPVKVRTVIIGGSRRMVVWDDLSSTQKLSLYDKGVDIAPTLDDASRREKMISYRVGDVLSPALPTDEALGGVVDEFARSIREGRPPRTDGHAGLRIMRILEAASASMASQGALQSVERGNESR
jgi:predicted dehydrogenase